VSNPALEGTLPTEVNSTQEELAIFNIAYLHFADCIMSKINDISYYFRPAAGKFEHWAYKSEASEEQKQMTVKSF